MVRLIRAETLDDALRELAEVVWRNEENGQKTLIFCEDRLTLLAERAILSRSGGTFLSEVTTFARYLSGGEKILGKQGSVIKISELILRRRKAGGYFGSGAARAVYETIAQLSASKVREEDLIRAAEGTKGTLKHKLGELAALLGEYKCFLSESGYVDESGYLALLPQKLSMARLGETNVVFFAFSSFTKQAAESVAVCLDEARSTTGIFLGGDAPVYTNGAVKVIGKLLKERGEAAAIEEAASTLTGERRTLFEALYEPARKRERAKGIYLSEAADETEELERVAAVIKRKISHGARYRDIALLIPQEGYTLAVEKVFGAYKIPFYGERRRKLSTHPFSQFCFALLEAVSDGVTCDEADAIASNVCFGGADEYRNYLLRYGAYRGAVRKKPLAAGEEDRGISEGYQRMNAFLREIPERATGRDYVNSVRRIFSLVGWENIHEEIRRDAALFGGGLSAEEEKFLEIGLNEEPFGKVLSETEAVAGDRIFTAREFARTLKSGLEAAEVSMIPSLSDAVFVGDVAKSAFARVDTLFVCGLTQGIPAVTEDTAIITDGEISALGEVRVEIEPAIREVNARGRESVYLNVIGYRNELYLSRPTQLRGEEVRESEILSAVRAAFVPVPFQESFPYDCSERLPALLRMYAERERFERGEEYDAARYNAIAEALKTIPEDCTQKTSALAGALWFEKAVSPTLLEAYFKCPYAGFATRALRLEERREANSRADAGTFVHEVLQRAAASFNEIQDAETLKRLTERTADGLLSDPRYCALQDTQKGKYAFDWLKRECVAVAEAAWQQLKKSAFCVKTVEQTVEIKPLNLVGKIDRVDEADGFVRVVDYKTGVISDDATAYYTGRNLQPELYLLAASAGKTPAGAFYFPAKNGYLADGEHRFRMRGFYNADDEAFSRLDSEAADGEESALFEGKRGAAAENGMAGQDFQSFLHYAYLAAAGAEREMKAGNIAPSPYAGQCVYCKLGALCGFTGQERREPDLKCSDIVNAVKESEE